MNESVGNAFLFNIVISIVIILLAFFIGSMSYSKASKVKNKIIEEIEKQGEYDDPSTRTEGAKIYENAEEEILNWLSSSGIGYKKNANFGQTNKSCANNDETGGVLVNTVSDYEYCVYYHNTCSEVESEINTGTEGDTETIEGKNEILPEASTSSKCGEYFTVITYMYFDIPVIQELIKIPVKGETMTFSQITS